MATAEVRQTPTSFGADGNEAPLRVGRDGSVITKDFVTQLALEGKLFICGVGLEGTALTGLTALAETTPSLVLKSPSGGNLKVMPLYFEALMSAEGGAAPDWYINVVTDDIAIATAGTSITAQSLGRVGASSAAIIQLDPTLAAYTNSQNTLLANAQNTLDNVISAEGATLAVLSNDLMNNQTKIVWAPKFPLVLADGQMWAFYGVTGTTGSGYEWSLVYAEIDPSVHG